MKPAVAEWVSKAEGDFLTAGRDLRARKSPNYDAVCFHAQQCAEKYLKAVLQENGKRIPKIRDPRSPALFIHKEKYLYNPGRLLSRFRKRWG